MAGMRRRNLQMVSVSTERNADEIADPRLSRCPYFISRTAVKHMPNDDGAAGLTGTRKWVIVER